jgi:DNA-binding HxlR family transcriptional regulator
MRKYAQDCPIARTLDIVGDRWTLIILRDLFFGRTKFSEFRDASPAPPPKLLSARLKMLTDEGLIERNVYSEHPLRADYRLTERGHTLLPVILAIGKWGLDNMYDGDPELRAEVASYIYDRIPETRPILTEAGYAEGSA